MPFDEYPDDRGVHYPVALIYSILVALIWIPAASARFIAQAFRELGTESWPRADGIVTSGDVKVIHGWLLDYAVGRVDYCYKTRGEYYSGHIVRQFADEQSAWDFVDSRRDKAVLIRYRDDQPEVSVLRASDQFRLSGLEGESGLVTQLWQHWKDELRREPRDPELDPGPDHDLEDEDEPFSKIPGQGLQK